MALTLGDNFSYQGAKPLDARLKYDTLANMKAVGDATMYDGCLAYCAETDKTYQWKSTNTVDADTGKWREFSSGGGGSYTAGDSILINNNVISGDNMQSGDMADVVNPTPGSGGSHLTIDANPTGTIIAFMGVTAPVGYLFCNGATYNISTYPTLAEFFRVQFGSVSYFGGNGTTTFAVPDLRGEFLRGTGTNSHTQTQAGTSFREGSGASVGTHQSGSYHMKSLSITRSEDASTYKNVGIMVQGQAAFEETLDGELSRTGGTNTQIGHADTNAGTFSSSGTQVVGGTTRPTNTSVLYCIKY